MKLHPKVPSSIFYFKKGEKVYKWGLDQKPSKQERKRKRKSTD